MDEIIFYSGDDRCAAWYFASSGEAFAGSKGRPCVVMAPGFASTRDTGGLVAYAEGIAAARRLPGVDPERIVLWGISNSGGHVIRVAAADAGVAAVMSVTPAVDGVAVVAQLA